MNKPFLARKFMIFGLWIFAGIFLMVTLLLMSSVGVHPFWMYLLTILFALAMMYNLFFSKQKVQPKAEPPTSDTRSSLEPNPALPALSEYAETRSMTPGEYEALWEPEHYVGEWPVFPRKEK